MLSLAPEVAAALEGGRAVVALESTIIAHGLPRPENLSTARAVEAEVRAAGAVPATIAVMDGRLLVGLDATQLERLALAPGVAKVSRRDLAPVLARGGLGATTVAATMVAAHLAGIRLFATGGIGGVHRGGETSLDVSADLHELARTPVAVVCAGAKAILDLPRTLEVLETLGVPVIGYGTDRFPAFWVSDSGLPVPARCDDPDEVAAVLAAQRRLGPGGGVLVAQPLPEAEALPRALVETVLEGALEAAAADGIQGAAVTPFLLRRLVEATGGRTLAANVALVRANARLAARIAGALVALER